MCHIIKLRCAVIQRQSWLAEMRGKITLSIHGDLRHSLGRGDSVNERRNWHSMIQTGNLGGGGGAKRSPSVSLRNVYLRTYYIPYLWAG